MNYRITGDGRTIPQGTSFTNINGYTDIDTPDQEDLYCEFEITDEGDITLRFKDRQTAVAVVDMLLNKRFSGFGLLYKPAKRRDT